MEADWLRSRLESGRSIESIAREAGKHPSTVGYWVKKHGLMSHHAAQHAPRGGIPREVLQSLIDEGLSIRAMSERLGLSYATVRHWLRRYELSTPRARRLAQTALARANGAAVVTATCDRHGETKFDRRAEGGYRCLRCRSEAVVARRRRVKSALIDDAGGACVACGYDRSPAALQFHHVDPATKRFGIAHRGMARALDAARVEALKCVLLCANCHAEVEAGVATLPVSGPATAGPG
jgi:transposase-like protein